jgi:hypothetical protein
VKQQLRWGVKTAINSGFGRWFSARQAPDARAKSEAGFLAATFLGVYSRQRCATKHLFVIVAAIICIAAYAVFASAGRLFYQ